MLVVVESAETTVEGFVVDYAKMDAFKKRLDEEYDHRDLNEVLATDQTTAEYLASHFAWVATTTILPGHPAVRLHKVVVKETEATFAEWRAS